MNAAADGGRITLLHPASSRTHTVNTIHKIPRAIIYKIEYLGKNRIHSISLFASFIKKGDAASSAA